jgi:hypothetical protein
VDPVTQEKEAFNFVSFSDDKQLSLLFTPAYDAYAKTFYNPADQPEDATDGPMSSAAEFVYKPTCFLHVFFLHVNIELLGRGPQKGRRGRPKGGNKLAAAAAEVAAEARRIRQEAKQAALIAAAKPQRVLQLPAAHASAGDA